MGGRPLKPLMTGLASNGGANVFHNSMSFSISLFVFTFAVEQLGHGLRLTVPNDTWSQLK